MYLESILDKIKKHVKIYKDGSKDLRIRCPYCGDSKKHKTSCHLYISKEPVKPYNTYVYHCFRAECEARGTLYELVSDLNLLPLLTKEEQLFLLKNTSIRKRNIEFQNVNVEELRIFDPSDRKLEYVKYRLGLSDIPEFISKTLVTNFSRFNLENKKLQFLLNKDFIGFKTFDGCKIVCRNTNKSSDFRYYNIYVRNKMDFYITSPKLNEINLFTPGYIFVAEGIFSVLKGYLHLKDWEYIKEKNNIVLSACLGGKPITFKTCIQFIQHSLGIPDWKVFILSDSEVPSWKYKELKDLPCEIEILYNTKGEDFGTSECHPTLVRLR